MGVSRNDCSEFSIKSHKKSCEIAHSAPCKQLSGLLYSYLTTSRFLYLILVECHWPSARCCTPPTIPQVLYPL